MARIIEIKFMSKAQTSTGRMIGYLFLIYVEKKTFYNIWNFMKKFVFH